MDANRISYLKRNGFSEQCLRKLVEMQDSVSAQLQPMQQRIRELVRKFAHSCYLPKYECEKLLRESGLRGKALKIALNDVWAAVELIRKLKSQLQNLRRNRYSSVKPSMRCRLDKKIAACVEQAYRNTIRMSVNNKSLIVEHRSATPGVLVQPYKEWPYKGSYRSFPMTCYKTTIRVGPFWLSSVHSRGLSTLGKYFILDLRLRYVSCQGVAFYDAVGVTNTRGVVVRCQVLSVAILAGGRVAFEDKSGGMAALAAYVQKLH